MAPELLSQVEAGNLSAVARDVGFGVFRSESEFMKN